MRAEQRSSAPHPAPIRGWVSLKLPELQRFRELLYLLVRRNIKESTLQADCDWGGLGDHIAFTTMITFSLFFGVCTAHFQHGMPLL